MFKKPIRTTAENNVALWTAELEAHVKAFLAEADKDLELEDLLPLENVTLIPIHVPTIPSFVPFTISTSTGGKGPGNQWKHLEYIVGSGWRYLPLTHQ